MDTNWLLSLKYTGKYLLMATDDPILLRSNAPTSSMTYDLSGLSQAVRRERRKLEWIFYRDIYPRLRRLDRRQNRHVDEWRRFPMAYTRIAEVPLTYCLLDAQPEQYVLDVASPKLLPLYMLINGFRNIILSDIMDYFASDCSDVASLFAKTPMMGAFDARMLPFPDCQFERVFSVSAIEHIPGDGDIQAVREIGRVLAPGGLFVMTLPAFPKPVMEYKKTYWEKHSSKDGQGRIFYQRRYNTEDIYKRFGGQGLQIQLIVYIAEIPKEPPRLSAEGYVVHNRHFVEKKLINAERKLRNIPFIWRLSKADVWPYVLFRKYATHFQYLTRDDADPNVRQVAVLLKKI